MAKVFKFKNREYGVVGLGEIMLRLSSPINELIIQGDTFEKQIGGSELNVISGLESLGRRGAIISKIPDNELGRFVKRKVRASGASDDFLIYDNSREKRLGIYYYEYGAYPRKPSVIYDRNYSSFTTLDMREINPDVFEKTEIFHVSGITLALCENTKNLTIELIKKFKEAGALISFDVNFRANLWTNEEARGIIETILPYLDILFMSEECFIKMFNLEGTLEEMQREFADKYDIEVVASTQREVISPKKHNFSSKVYHKSENCFFTEEKYRDIDVIDRIGSGDAYLSGALYGLLEYNSIEKFVQYGNAMSVVKNTTMGDMAIVDHKLIESVIKDHNNLGEGSELNR